LVVAPFCALMTIVAACGGSSGIKLTDADAFANVRTAMTQVGLLCSNVLLNVSMSCDNPAHPVRRSAISACRCPHGLPLPEGVSADVWTYGPLNLVVNRSQDAGQLTAIESRIQNLSGARRERSHSG
jgi:hypothetical protein